MELMNLPIFLVFQIVIVSIVCEPNQVIPYENINLQYLADKLVNSESNDVSEKCMTQFTAVQNEQDVFQRMADAWTKFPYTGVLQSTRKDFGDFDECVSIDMTDPTAGRILGKHCTYGLVLPDFTVTNKTEMIAKAWQLSYCAPDACTASDLNNALKKTLDLPLFNEAICSTKERPKMDVGGAISLAIFLLITAVMIIATLYDTYLYYTEQKNSSIILRAYSMIGNGKSLLSTVSHSKEQVLCFHGLKFISMWWIIAGHNGTGWKQYSVMNELDAKNWLVKLSSFYLTTGHLAVDTFFFISGFLLAYLYFKNEISKKSLATQCKAVPVMIVHRYLRLTPAILVTFLFAVFLQKYVGTGPLYAYYAHSMAKPCKDYWWSVFLYVQNYYVFAKTNAICITTLWYVSADMQLFLISPLIIIPIALLNRRSFRNAMAALLTVNLIFVALPILTKLTWRDYDPNFEEFDSHSRLTDYFIGVMMGLFLRHQKNKTYRFSTKTNMFIWTIVILTMLGCALATQEANIHNTYINKTLIVSFTRSLWCMGLCWVTFACFTGRGGLINFILSNSFMQIGGKLSYSLYLVHGPIITIFATTLRHRRILTDWYLFYDWCGHFITSMIVATFWTLAFEMPMITLEKAMFGAGKPRPQKSEPTT